MKPFPFSKWTIQAWKKKLEQTGLKQLSSQVRKALTKAIEETKR